ncbi:sulfotransferase domain-containing protein [Psychromarinibacter sp. C21-152]|uniref:Sulfotransferase domain-containing protein n=1 Tax=Psychromarinibacter sediminicola TaxID=3033385 RepID=A0AAE3T935_9RHOB|nr:sulfotransferase domain-containing protein [Psychromarinibacter sediminicola]MDF0602090.1 sulfotransferase domain-containing protein [Psychromarinibacter sediminicola]
MSTPAHILQPALRSYRGTITSPERWSVWEPRRGDILVCTPPKSGTTWTQSMLSMLLHGSTELPDRVPVLSPWVDADLGAPADEIAAALRTQPGRRVVKTHTPADGFPLWDGVTVIAVYRHPLDVFFSLRAHNANVAEPEPDDPFLLPLERAFRHYVEDPADTGDFDRDTLAALALHYRETALSGRLPELKLFHYADMLRDGRSTVEKLARAVGVEASAELIDTVTAATSFESMKANAQDYAPVAGTGFWKSDADFFESASSRKWKGQLSTEQIATYDARIRALVGDARARRWLETGDGPTTAKDERQ